MPEARPSCTEVTVIAGGESLRVTGRAAAIIGLLAAQADRVNAVPVGKLIAHFAQGQVKLEVAESLPAVRLDK